uniref:cytochrome-c oxidase n=1 Tax=Rozella allomycis TaxID=281847 RepID=R9R6T2_9FUNG|nr:cytochrome c oxidase subunit 2 [Rozella allomycis]AGK83069.1 cytochrome c oxidase subunit 2 [Rozella allomycis]
MFILQRNKFMYMDWPIFINYSFNEEGVFNYIDRIELYDVYLYYGILIIISIYFILYIILIFKNNFIKLSQYEKIEIIYIFIPTLLIIIIFLPSINLLYSNDKLMYINTYIMIIGYQWYWNYNILEYGYIEIYITTYNNNDLYNILENYIELDNIIILPIIYKCCYLFTSGDVIHSYGILSLGIKMDCIPGIININYIIVLKKGIYVGYCSELCGSYHNNMNILLNYTYYSWYIKYLNYY